MHGSREDPRVARGRRGRGTHREASRRTPIMHGCGKSDGREIRTATPLAALRLWRVAGSRRLAHDFATEMLPGTRDAAVLPAPPGCPRCVHGPPRSATAWSSPTPA